ncbi:type III secretion protein [Paraburkholderia sp. 22099]|jgi:type III secretion system HrpB7-like protein|uniref:type III secretion protein n=1 Tax=Paraburkholderia TaxID=1822464 RepID=UPI0028588C6F|nr:type III secretion protein [Paraburkholderia terricola]MDR6494359.1 type III secretion system HrpB7-like protein [Paraburkholderia terricola]
MSAAPNPDTTRRRVAALGHTVSRRGRLDTRLQAALTARRDAHAQAVARHDAQRERVELAGDELRAYRERVARMMSGGSAFQLADLNATMRYADVVAARVQQLESELAALETAMRAAAEELAAAARALANNRGRMDLCRERIDTLRRSLDQHAADEADEDAEETALARLRLMPRPA